MNYFNYAIKCVIRNIIYKLMKPRNLIIIIVSLVIIFLLSSYTTVFGWTGNDDYTDRNATIVLNYDSINQDLLNRIKYYSGGNSTNIENLINDLKNNNFNFYAFYGSSSDGSSMTGQTIFANYDLYVYFYQRDVVPDSSIYDIYQGMETSYKKINSGNIYGYIFEGGNISTFTPPSSGFHIPTVLINYKSSVIYDYINSDSQSQTNSIVGAINQQTNTINQQTQVIQEQTESINSTDFDENEVSIDTSSSNIDNSQQQGLFTTIFTNFNNSISNDNVEYLNIPLVNNQSLSIPSNIVSSHLGSLSLLINAFWFYVFGLYAFKFVNNLIIKIKDGSILDGYTSNEVITSDMM